MEFLDVLSISMMYLKKNYVHLEIKNSVGLIETEPFRCGLSDLDIHAYSKTNLEKKILNGDNSKRGPFAKRPISFSKMPLLLESMYLFIM